MIEPTARVQRQQAIAKTAIVGAIANLLLSAGKLGIGYMAHSQALIADGIHSLSDLLSDLLVWVAGNHASQAPDAEHPYGHGRYETLATLLLGVLLLLVALELAWDAVGRLFAPDQLLHPGPLALLAAAASILINEALFWYTLFYARRIRSDLLRANAWHHRSDSLSSVVVFIGIAGTMAGLSYLDAIATVLVAIMIAKIALGLGWESMQELVDTSLEADRLEEIRKTILSIGGVRDMHMLRTRKHGGFASADVHILVDPQISVSEGHMIGTLAGRQIKKTVDEIRDVTVHIDPEDDEKHPLVQELPLRAEALRRLDAHWARIPEAAQHRRILLHYLNGRIDVEVFFPRKILLESCKEIDLLTQRLQQAVAEDKIFGTVRAYFG